MSDEQGFMQAIQDSPHDLQLRMVFADWLEERGDPRGELLRLSHALTQSIDLPDRPKMESRLRDLLCQGVKPVGPFFTNSIGMKFAWIPAGTFRMGSPAHEEGRTDAETLHEVTLSKGFFMGVYPVSQLQWQTVTGKLGGVEGDNYPVRDDLGRCQKFCKRLGKSERRRYRLPTEAEWEYACRAGTTTAFYFGDSIQGGQANFSTQARSNGPTVVGSYPPNAWGLYDMYGNVWEWCADLYAEYPLGAVVDPQGPETVVEELRVQRGGCWASKPEECRSAFRWWERPTVKEYFSGCRVCFSLE